jgi:glycosyltransferase involved in cell wall biosynthesis
VSDAGRGRVALLTPFGPPSVRGNAITVERIARGLQARGMAVRIWDLSALPAPTIEREVVAYRPTLVHAFHASRVGPLGLDLAARAGVPLVVTITGTDANHDLLDAGRGPEVRRVLLSAARIVAFHESIAAAVAAVVPEISSRTSVIPQAVWLPEGERFDLDAAWPLPADRVLFLCPSGLRPVKNPVLPLVAFDRLIERRPAVRLLYVGPVIDPDCGAELHRELAARPWARHLGAIPHGQMASLLRAADVVVNASVSEGGMANSVLEGMAAGRPVLASDISGNRSLVEDGVTGLLFDGAEALEKAAGRLADCPGLRHALGQAGQEVVRRLYPPEREIGGYATLYREVRDFGRA